MDSDTVKPDAGANAARDDGEYRRAEALHAAITHLDGSGDAAYAVSAARTFEGYLRGDTA